MAPVDDEVGDEREQHADHRQHCSTMRAQTYTHFDCEGTHGAGRASGTSARRRQRQRGKFTVTSTQPFTGLSPRAFTHEDGATATSSITQLLWVWYTDGCCSVCRDDNVQRRSGQQHDWTTSTPRWYAPGGQAVPLTGEELQPKQRKVQRLCRAHWGPRQHTGDKTGRVSGGQGGHWEFEITIAVQPRRSRLAVNNSSATAKASFQ